MALSVSITSMRDSVIHESVVTVLGFWEDGILNTRYEVDVVTFNCLQVSFHFNRT